MTCLNQINSNMAPICPTGANVIRVLFVVLCIQCVQGYFPQSGALPEGTSHDTNIQVIKIICTNIDRPQQGPSMKQISDTTTCNVYAMAFHKNRLQHEVYL